MPELTPQLPEIDRLAHEPARLAILTVLSNCTTADFVALQRITGLSKGDLSVQLAKLEEAGLVRLERVLLERKTRTDASLTPLGVKEVARYWKTMDRLRKGAGL